MNISDVAAQTGLPPKTIRYYEDIGLIAPLRQANGYRVFRDTDLHKLTFMGRARALGFSVADCRTLMQLYDDKTRSSFEVKAVAREHLLQIEAKITDLQRMHATLSDLVRACHGDDRPECPILDTLGKG